MTALHIMPGGLWLRHTTACARLLACRQYAARLALVNTKKAAQMGGFTFRKLWPVIIHCHRLLLRILQGLL